MTKKPLSARKKPTQSRSQQTVDAILQAAAHILSQDDSPKFNTNYLAKIAGVSIGSIYQYFPNKESIVSALISRYANSQGQIVTDALLAWTEEQSIEELLNGVIEQIFLYRRQELKLSQAVSAQMFGGQLSNEMGKWKKKLSAMITDILFDMKYSTNAHRLGVKVHMVVELCDQAMDHILNQELSKHDRDYALSHMQKLVLHSLSIDQQ